MKKIFTTTLLVLGLTCVSAPSYATLTYNLGGCDFTSDDGGTGTCGGSGADIPQNALIMTFEQIGSNLVKMTLDATNMPVGLGKISDVWFNVDGFTFPDLSFAWVSDVEADDILAGGNVGNMGIFNLNFEYATSGQLGEFFYGKKSIYNISSNTDTDLFEDDFNDLSTGGFAAAFHLNITGNGNSGHYTTGNPVPEPATMLLFGTGLVGLAGLARRKK